MHDGQPPAGKIRSTWEGILEDAGLGQDVARHSLRHHTAATWQMQAGTDLWEAAGWLGMTVEQLEQNYGHHHPDFQEDAAEASGDDARHPVSRQLLLRA
jgi:integrase